MRETYGLANAPEDEYLRGHFLFPIAGGCHETETHLVRALVVRVGSGLDGVADAERRVRNRRSILMGGKHV